MTPATFQQAIKKHNDKFEKKTDALFKRFNAEVKRLKLSSIPETNKLWNQKYKKPLDKMEAINDKEYKSLWYKFNKS